MLLGVELNEVLVFCWEYMVYSGSLMFILVIRYCLWMVFNVLVYNDVNMVCIFRIFSILLKND